MEIYIISTTYMAAGSELQTLNNANIRLLNEQLLAKSGEWNTGFIDVAQYMCDSSDVFFRHTVATAMCTLPLQHMTSG
jgi:hypothetical protein